MGNPGTQVISRKALADAATPPYMTAVDAAIQKAADEKDRGARLKRFEDALQLLEGHLQGKKPELHDCLALAECYWELTQPQKAIDHLKQAIQLAPKDARPYALLGRYLMYKGLRDQALNFLDRAIQLDPDDAATRKLRDRAALNKKKSYTVVVNAADLQGLGQKKAQGGAAKKKAEATRMIEIGQVAGATAELEKAAHGESNEVDAALGALFGADLLGADLDILKAGQEKGRGIGIVRTAIAFVFIAMLGLVAGILFEQLGPEGSSSQEDQLEAMIASDLTTQIDAAALKAEEKGEGSLHQAALAHALMLADHGGQGFHLDSALSILEGADEELRQSAEGLAARVLLQGHPEAPQDPDLDKDLSEASQDEERKNAPWLLMARADRAAQLGADDVAFSLLHQAGLGKRGLPRALHLLGRAYAQRGELDAAIDHFERLWTKQPNHPGSLAAAAALAVMKARAEDPEAGAEEMTKLEEKILKRVDGDDIEPLDAAPAAVTLAAIAQARGDEQTRGIMLGLAIGSSSSGPVTQSAELLAEVTHLQILDFDPEAAEKLLKRNESLTDNSLPLLRNRTRATVLSGIGDQLRSLRVNSSRRAVTDAGLDLPGGSLRFDLDKRPVPLSSRFDARYFPETAIERALSVRTSAAVAERKLKTVAQIKLAQIALAEGDIETAQERLEGVRDDADGDPEFHLVEALVQSADADRRGAKKAIDEALNIAPDEPRILVAAARIQLASGDPRAALESVGALKREGFASPSALTVAARAHLAQGELDDARRAIQEGKAFTDDDPELLSGLIVVEHASAELQKAQAAATKLFEEARDTAQALGQTDPVVAAYVLDAMARAGREEAALEELAVLVEKSDELIVEYFLGAWQVASGERSEGLKKLRKVAARTGPATTFAQAKLEELGEGGERERKRRRRRRRR